MEEKYTTVHINGHFEVYNENDEFVMSCDTLAEYEEEIAELMSV